MKAILFKISLCICVSVLTSLSAVAQDSVSVHRSWLGRMAAPFVTFFSKVDTSYIEPNHFRFQAMMQGNYSLESYRVSNDNGNDITFSPSPSLKVGPYFGWSLIFLGATVNVMHLKNDDKRTEWNISLYTLPLGIDLFYRKSGNDYHISDFTLDHQHYPSMEDAGFGGFKSSVKGFNIYYIFNHQHFSYPAAFNQSTQQKQSCGSALLGIGYTHHTLDIDWEELNKLTMDRTDMTKDELLSSDLKFEKVKYSDLSVSGGYGYNWVFAQNWLFAASASLAASYKRTISNSETDYFGTGFDFHNFKLQDLTIDAIGRFGLVWTNRRWFAGASAVLHSYNYSREQFHLNDNFGEIKAYVGFNFGRK